MFLAYEWLLNCTFEGMKRFALLTFLITSELFASATGNSSAQGFDLNGDRNINVNQCQAQKISDEYLKREFIMKFLPAEKQKELQTVTYSRASGFLDMQFDSQLKRMKCSSTTSSSGVAKLSCDFVQGMEPTNVLSLNFEVTRRVVDGLCLETLRSKGHFGTDNPNMNKFFAWKIGAAHNKVMGQVVTAFNSLPTVTVTAARSTGRRPSKNGVLHPNSVVDGSDTTVEK